MKKTIVPLLFVLIISSITFARIEHWFEIQLRYDNGNISYYSIQVKPVTTESKIENIPGGYIAEVVSYNGEILNLTFFDIPLIIEYDNVDVQSEEIVGGGLINLNKSEVTIKVPYYENAKEINIYDKNITKRLTIDITDFSKITALKKEEKIIQPEEKIQIEEKKVKKNYLLYAILVLFIVLIFIFLIKKLRKQD